MSVKKLYDKYGTNNTRVMKNERAKEAWVIIWMLGVKKSARRIDKMIVDI